MATRALEHPKVRVLWNTRVTDVLGDASIPGLGLADTVTGAASALEVGRLSGEIWDTSHTTFIYATRATPPHCTAVVHRGDRRSALARL